jgi:hypothetical protein
MNQLHIHDLYDLFCFKGPNQLYVILKKIKVSEFLLIMTFNILCTSSFDTKCVHRTMETPLMDVVSF